MRLCVTLHGPAPSVHAFAVIAASASERSSATAGAREGSLAAMRERIDSSVVRLKRTSDPAIVPYSHAVFHDLQLPIANTQTVGGGVRR